MKIVVFYVILLPELMLLFIPEAFPGGAIQKNKGGICMKQNNSLTKWQILFWE